MIKYIHVPCGAVAMSFNRDTPIQHGELLEAKDWAWFDGKTWAQCQSHEPFPRCWKCGQPLRMGPQTLEVQQ